jgi:hypothetical protein
VSGYAYLTVLEPYSRIVTGTYMNKSRFPSEPALLESAARLSNLSLSGERAAQLVPAMDGVFQLLDALHQAPLAETAPAFAFKARWEA